MSASSEHGTSDESVRRNRKGEMTRARLLEAATRIFERDGFYAARLTDIAEEAGVAVSSTYHYFGSKEDVFRELVRIHEESLLAPPDGEDAGLLATEAGLLGLRLSIERFFRRTQAHARFLGLVEQVARHDQTVNNVRMATVDAFVQGVTAAVVQMQGDGHADPDLDPGITADALVAMASRFAEQWIIFGDRDYDFDHVVEQLTRLIANALALPPGSR